VVFLTTLSRFGFLMQYSPLYQCSAAVAQKEILSQENTPNFAPKALGTDLLRTLNLEEM
jgi:hypothetical protein